LNHSKADSGIPLDSTGSEFALGKTPADFMETMTETMLDEVYRIAPRAAQWLNRVGNGDTPKFAMLEIERLESQFSRPFPPFANYFGPPTASLNGLRCKLAPRRLTLSRN
jgi:hypothetical protein